MMKRSQITLALLALMVCAATAREPKTDTGIRQCVDSMTPLIRKPSSFTVAVAFVALSGCVAGVDKVFHPAQAKIVGKTVVVNSAEVPQLVAVRYGWANVSEGNLFNKVGLPATPFRTDVD